MYSIYNYRRILKVKPDKDRAFGYQAYRTIEELTDNYKRLWEQEIYPNLECGLCCAIYTQVSDIEEEINGLMTYDRKVDKLYGDTVRKLNENLYRMFQEMT